MAGLKTFLKSGHPPTLFCAFLYFDFCFAIWVLNGAMMPFIAEAFKLGAAQKGVVLAVPIVSGALLRFPLGVLAQYIGRKWAAVVEMGTIIIGLAWGFFFLSEFTYTLSATTWPFTVLTGIPLSIIIMGIILGIAGASFGVALSLGGGWFPPEHKGLAIGIAGAGNSGAVLALLFAPPLAIAYGWQNVYGFAILLMTLPLILMIFVAKEPPDRAQKSFGEMMTVLVEKDAWIFNVSYILTFGGYIGFTMFLPTLFHDGYGVSKAAMGFWAAPITLMASVTRIIGGVVADRIGGLKVMTFIAVVVVILALIASTMPPLPVMAVLMFLIFCALGAGNGSTFQLVPLRWPVTTAIAMSLIGEIGALGGGLVTTSMGLSKQNWGNYSGGYYLWAAIAAIMFIMYFVVRKRWTTSWVGPGGVALSREEYEKRKIEGRLHT